MKKKSSSKRWLQEHFSDPYVIKAQAEGFRSRAVYKLKELQERDRLFKPGMTVVDLGSAPGGWGQALVPLIGRKGKIFALDILDMAPIDGVDFIQGDFTQDAVFDALMELLQGAKVDWVISDMSPNLSGHESVDQPKHMELAELALDFAIKVLPDGGGFLVKMFMGEGFDPFIVSVRQHFKKVVIRKPKASRDRSREVYLLAREFSSASSRVQV
jgi:23S rRNA (uridine2552-2'-O)-methyltransferase